MLSLTLRRARVQGGMLASVVGLIAAAACLVGVCTLLLSSTQTRAFHAEVERAQPGDVDVTAFLVDLPGSELEDARSRAERAVSEVLAPMRPTVTASAVGAMRQIDPDRVAYLGTDDDVARRAVLTAGSWPNDVRTGTVEAAVPAVAARLLGLRVGDTVTLDQELGLSGVSSVAEPITVTVVGTFQPRPGPGWDTDPLSGQGYAASWAHGTSSPSAYGPVLVGDAAFAGSGSYVTGLRVTAHPTLSLARRSTLDDAARGVGRASSVLTVGVGDRVRITRVASNLRSTLDHIDAQQATTRSTVLVVVLLGVALSAAAALLAGWLVASRRDDERALLVALGRSGRQQLAAALTEAGLLAGTAALLAVPTAAIAHSLLTHGSGLRTAGLAQGPTITVPLVVSVVACTLLLALTLVLTALGNGTATDRGSRQRAAARGSLDLLLAIVAVVCWWQVRAQPTDASGDVVLTAAPVLCLAAVTVLAVRLVPLVLGAAARAAARSRGLVLPLAAQQAARRPHAGTAMVAIAAAVAAATFGLGLHSTWETSQDDQAALRLGTDLVLVPAATSGQRATTAVESATEQGALGRTVSPVIDRPLSLGSFVGQDGVPPVLVAVDATHAGDLLRGRLGDGTTWAQVGDRIAPSDPVPGIVLPSDGEGVQIVASGPDRAGLRVTATAVVQDAADIRRSVGAAPVPMDGRPHAVSWLGVIDEGQELVGVRLQLTGTSLPEQRRLAVALRIPGTTTRAGDGPWAVVPGASAGGGDTLSGTDVGVRSTGDDTVVRMTTTADLTYFGYSSNEILTTAIPTPSDVPVAVSQDLVDTVAAPVGTTLTASLNGTSVRLRVVAVVPDVPSAPGRVAVLADGDLLGRALVDAGELDPGYDAWWIGDPAPATVRAAERLGVGEVTTRADVAAGLAHGPVRVALPTALSALVAAAGLMLLLSVALLLASDRQRRTAEVSRLRALGLASRAARLVLLAENTAFLLPLVVVGALVGRATAAVLGPDLIRSDVGGPPMPAAVDAWPWGAELLLVGGSALGALAIAAVLTAAHVRRADPARLQAGETG